MIIPQEAGATRSHFMVPDGNSYYKSDGSWDDRLTYHYVTANDMVKITLLLVWTQLMLIIQKLLRMINQL